jgi:hypothetical protein
MMRNYAKDEISVEIKPGKLFHEFLKMDISTRIRRFYTLVKPIVSMQTQE